MYKCSDPGRESIRRDIREHRLNRVVVASCTPLLHEHTFRKAEAWGGLNPFYAYDPCLGCATHSLPGHLPLLVKIYDSKQQLVQELRQD